MVIVGRILGGIVGLTLGLLVVEVWFFDELEDIGVGDYWGTVIIIAFTVLGIVLGSLAGRAVARDTP
jgi:uncharacterized membrane protein